MSDERAGQIVSDGATNSGASGRWTWFLFGWCVGMIVTILERGLLLRPAASINWPVFAFAAAITVVLGVAAVIRP